MATPAPPKLHSAPQLQQPRTRPAQVQAPLPENPELPEQGPAPARASAIGHAVGGILAGLTGNKQIQNDVQQAALQAAYLAAQREESYRQEGFERAKIVYQAKLDERRAIRADNLAREGLDLQREQNDALTAHYANQDNIAAVNAMNEQVVKSYEMQIQRLQLEAQMGLIDAQEAELKMRGLESILNSVREFSAMILGGGTGSKSPGLGGSAQGTGGPGGGASSSGDLSKLDPKVGMSELLQKDPTAFNLVNQIQAYAARAANGDEAAAKEVDRLTQELDKRESRVLARQLLVAKNAELMAAGGVGDVPNHFDPSVFDDFLTQLEGQNPLAASLYRGVLAQFPDPSQTPDARAGTAFLSAGAALAAVDPNFADRVGASYVTLATKAGIDPEIAREAWEQAEQERRSIEDLPGFEDIRALMPAALEGQYGTEQMPSPSPDNTQSDNTQSTASPRVPSVAEHTVKTFGRDFTHGFRKFNPVFGLARIIDAARAPYKPPAAPDDKKK